MALVEFLCLLTNQYFVFVSVMFSFSKKSEPISNDLCLRDQILLFKNLKVVLILKYKLIYRFRDIGLKAKLSKLSIVYSK